MSEVTDLVLPILRNLQQEMTALRSKVDDIGENVADQGEKIDELKHYMTMHMGVTMQHSLDIGEIKARLTALEQAP